jgi:hypothetical protein
MKRLAQREKKIPVLALASKGKPGCLLVVDSADLPALVAEHGKAAPVKSQSSDGSDPDIGHERNTTSGRDASISTECLSNQR